MRLFKRKDKEVVVKKLVVEEVKAVKRNSNPVKEASKKEALRLKKESN